MMPFLQPSLLYWLPLAAVPLGLWLLLRLRRSEVDWGASYILRLTLRTRRARSRWQQAVILALRTAVLVGLVVALARPLGAPPAGGGGAGAVAAHPVGSLHRVVLLDNSQSMLAAYEATSRIGVTRGLLAELLAGGQAGDTCHVVPMCPGGAGGRVEARAVACPIGLEEARRLAAAIEPAATPADTSAALRAAVEAFRGSAAAHRQLVILTDLARVDHPSIGDYAVFGAMLRRLGVTVSTLSFGSHQVGNVALEGLSPGSDLVLAGQPTNVYLEAINYGESASGDLLLQLLIDGQAAREEVVSLPAGQRRTIAYEVKLPAGEHSLECRLAPDAFPADNRIRRFVVARPGLDVLLVAPSSAAATQAAGGDAFARDDEFLRRLLKAPAPFEIRTHTSAEADLLPQAFRDVDVAFLCGVTKLSPPTRQAAEAFVRRGGGLVLSVAPGMDAPSFNRTFADLLPAPLAEPFRTDFDEQRYLSVQAADATVLMLREFEGAAGLDLSSGRVYNHFRVFAPSQSPAGVLPQSPAAAPAGVLLTLANGDPLLLSRRYGKGVVLLWTTTQGAAWNSLVVQQAHLPLVYRMMNWAAGFRDPPRNVQPGEPLICAVPAFAAPAVAGDAVQAFMTTPGRKLVPCPMVVAPGGRSFVRFEHTAESGDYELRDAGDKPLARFSVARPRAESDLRVLRDEEAHRFEQALDTTIAHSPAELRGTLAQAGSGVERAGWFLIAVLALLLLDGLLTRVWFR